MVLGDLLQLLGIVEGHHGDALRINRYYKTTVIRSMLPYLGLCVRDEGARLAGISVDDALRLDAHAHHLEGDTVCYSNPKESDTVLQGEYC